MVRAPATDDGRCPGVLHAVTARGGFLARIRIPGGLLSTAQLRALAELCARYADSRIDLTVRANLQVRGISGDRLDDFARALADAGLLPSVTHERVRNILASPFSGVDPDELVDLRPLVRSLDAALIADAALARLPAKFCFALDGGGRPFDIGRADVRLRAVENEGRIALLLASPADAREKTVVPDDAVSALLEAAHCAIACGTSSVIRRPVANVPIGILQSNEPGRVNVVPSLPLGRLDAGQMRALASLVDACGADVRLAPWRGMVIGAVPNEALESLVEGLSRANLPVDDADGYRGIAACAGTDGCAAALADVRGDAAGLARRLAATQRPRRWSVNVAGCEKRCGMRGNAVVDVVATENGYDVASTGREPRRALAAEAAFDAVVEAAHS